MYVSSSLCKFMKSRQLLRLLQCCLLSHNYVSINDLTTTSNITWHNADDCPKTQGSPSLVHRFHLSRAWERGRTNLDFGWLQNKSPGRLGTRPLKRPLKLHKSAHIPKANSLVSNRPSSIHQYSGMATKLYGQISRLRSVFFVSKVSREISKQNNIHFNHKAS